MEKTTRGGAGGRVTTKKKMKNSKLHSSETASNYSNTAHRLRHPTNARASNQVGFRMTLLPCRSYEHCRMAYHLPTVPGDNGANTVSSSPQYRIQKWSQIIKQAQTQQQQRRRHNPVSWSSLGRTEIVCRFDMEPCHHMVGVKIRPRKACRYPNLRSFGWISYDKVGVL